MEYVYLLGSAQLLKPWNPIGHYYPHILFCTGCHTAPTLFHTNHQTPRSEKK